MDILNYEEGQFRGSKDGYWNECWRIETKTEKRWFGKIKNTMKTVKSITLKLKFTFLEWTDLL